MVQISLLLNFCKRIDCINSDYLIFMEKRETDYHILLQVKGARISMILQRERGNKASMWKSIVHIPLLLFSKYSE